MFSPSPSSPVHADAGTAPGVADPARVVRRYAHDARNDLNGLELSATLLEELAGEDADIAETAGQIRRHLNRLESAMRSLLLRFADHRPEEIPALALVDRWQAELNSTENGTPTVEWASPELPAALLRLDPAAVASAFSELTLAAIRHSGGSPPRMRVSASDGQLTFELREPAKASLPSPEQIAEWTSLLRWLGGRLEHCPDADRISETATRITFVVHQG
ncbi:MAG: HAMP domain-containing histidine kinase [Verrucomicrobiaceae bacterium]|nr:MAG: HAMP domain-containing histidine kinase [Verrucomicrobiaceae bacterium]